MDKPHWMPERIWKRVSIEHLGHHAGPCWIVSGWSDGKGHAKARHKGICTFVHRITLALFCGQQPHELDTVDHLCRNRACCNPAHLEDVTSAENTARGLGVHTQFKPADHYERMAA